MLNIPPHIRAEIQSHARETYPEECCGILLGTPGAGGGGATLKLAVRAENTADVATRAKRYLIDPRAILDADKIARAVNLEIVGFYHSHPDHPAVPSYTDLSLAWPDYIYIIAEAHANTPGELRAWRLGEDRTMKEVALG